MVNFLIISILGVRKQSSPRSSQSFLIVEPKPDVTRTVIENSEYDVTYLSKWRKVPFKIGSIFIALKYLLNLTNYF